LRKGTLFICSYLKPKAGSCKHGNQHGTQ